MADPPEGKYTVNKSVQIDVKLTWANGSGLSLPESGGSVPNRIFKRWRV